MSETQTRNLGELFRKALKNQPTKKQQNKVPRTHNKKSRTGIHCVTIIKCPGCIQGFMYQFASRANGNNTVLKSVDILRLKKKVLEAGHTWTISDEILAKQTAKKADISYEELI